MYEVYFRHLAKKMPLTADDQALIQRFLSVKKIRKKQYLLQEGDVCKVIAFVEKGALRSYTVDGEGKEHILQFALEGWFIADLYSFLTGEESSYNIEAIDDSELVLINQSAYKELLQRSPCYQTYMLDLITGAYIALQKRLNATVSLSPEERYQDLIALYPDIVQRVPQHMIASYMGLTPETLSRIRRRIAEN
ncbi:Crp/Fnr family transcriptional regulator [Fibrella sp. HMF5335]|uniref:Crp/Fnr family transcriptional regulator n=1 Tax=Fibrella rubiginis TaxID=2817060 RepID=A0A939K3N7_9BACT|nr:Crp/Fnr family transcriptional regulator [Fibrella rubiginis]MBO0935813.1 Crp/Fnr family transcriptional regulator [Fibrella rubiginis]